MKIKIFFLFSLLLGSILSVFSSFNVLPAIAYDAPRIYIKELDIQDVSYKAGDRISGQFKIWNTSDSIVSNLNYTISLKEVNDIINEETFSVAEQVYPDKTAKQDFSYRIPSNLKSGIYELKIQIFSRSGMPLNWKTKKIEIEGNGRFLIADRGFVLKDDKEFDPLVGINFDSNEPVKIKFLVSNASNSKINFIPEATIYWFQSNVKALDSISGGKYEINAQKEMEVEMNMPQFQKPGSYIAKVVLKEKNETVSNTASFRWVIKGMGARILNVTFNDDYVKADKKITTLVDLVGSADGSSAGQVQLAVNLYDHNSGKIIGSGSKDAEVGISIQREAVDVYPNLASNRFKVEVKVVKDGIELDSYSIDIGKVSDENESANISRRVFNNYNFAIYLIAAIIYSFFVLVVVIFGKAVIKNKKLFFLFLAFSSLISILSISTIGINFKKILNKKVSAIEIPSSLDVTWQQPMKDTSFNFEDPITYEGLALQGSCFNDVTMLETNAYVCDINKSNCVSSGFQRKYNVDTWGVALDPVNMKLFVLDGEWNNGRIIVVDMATKVQEAVLGSQGSGVGQFSNARDIYYSSPYLYVADTQNDRVIRFDPTDMLGTWQEFTSGGAGDTMNFELPEGVFFKSPYLYVSDTYNDRIVRINLSDNSWSEYFPPVGFGGFDDPMGVSFDGTYIYVADNGNSRVVRFKPDNTNWQEFTNFYGPEGIFYSSPYAYVADTNTTFSRIVMFDPEDEPGSRKEVSGLSGSQLSSPHRALYFEGFVYVADGGNNKRIVKFKYENPLDSGDDSDGDDIADGSWDVFDFLAESYKLETNIPSAISFGPSFVFANGITDYDADAILEPLGAVYAKVNITVEFADGTTGSESSFERIIIGNAFPTVEPLDPEPISYCENDLPEAVNLEWNYLGSGFQGAYEIELTRNDALVCRSGKVVGNRTNVSGVDINNFSDPNCSNFIDYGNRTYNWKVKVYDSSDNSSSFTDGKPFPYNMADIFSPIPTPTHKYPVASFSINPDPATNELSRFMNIEFDPSSSTSVVSIKKFKWDFDYKTGILGEPSVDVESAEYPPFNYIENHIYTEDGTYVIDLNVVDDSGYSCWAHDRGNEEVFNIGLVPARWGEIAP